MTDTSKREQLIEEAAKAILDAAETPDSVRDEQIWEWARRDARAALAVFEQTHTPSTPSDDEAHELGDLIEHVQTRYEATRDGYGQPLADFTAQAILAAGFRRTAVQEPSDAMLDALYDTFIAHSRGVEFNEFNEHVCSECGEAFAWPDGQGGYEVPWRRNKRHIALAALRAAYEEGKKR